MPESLSQYQYPKERLFFGGGEVGVSIFSLFYLFFFWGGGGGLKRNKPFLLLLLPGFQTVSRGKSHTACDQTQEHFPE